MYVSMEQLNLKDAVVKKSVASANTMNIVQVDRDAWQPLLGKFHQSSSIDKLGCNRLTIKTPPTCFWWT